MPQPQPHQLQSWYLNPRDEAQQHQGKWLWLSFLPYVLCESMSFPLLLGPRNRSCPSDTCPLQGKAGHKPREGWSAKAHLVLSKQQHGVIPALGDSQRHGPVHSTLCSCPQRLEAQRKPGESLPLPGRSPAPTQLNSPGPVTATGDGAPWGCITPCQHQVAPRTCQPSSHQLLRTSPSSCCDNLSTHPPDHAGGRLEQTSLLPQPARRGFGDARPHTQWLWQGGCYNGIYTTQRLQLLRQYQSDWTALSTFPQENLGWQGDLHDGGSCRVRGKAAGKISSAAMPRGVSGPGESRAQRTPGCRKPESLPGPAPP